jgi:dTDP-4-dehydrorhamnose 3,5-epimerase
VAVIETCSAIADLYVVQLKAFEDSRGRFQETFRKEWFPQRSWENLQTNRSDSRANVLRGLHYHHKQVDYWYVVNGLIRVGLYDMRPWSPTFKTAHTLLMGEERQVGLYIPTGVAHGFVSLTDATLTYLVDNYYDGADELGIAWNDPELRLDWGVTEPIVSGRDMNNPLLSNIPLTDWPRP